MLQKPPRLKAGDTVAAVSPCHGWAGDASIIWRYELGVRRLREAFSLRVIPAPHALKGSDYLRRHPEARAEDLLWAFESPEVRGILANVGGNDSHRLLPYLHEETVRRNPKVFMGYSDVLNLHLFCRRAGLSTFYGPNLLSPLADPQGLHPDTVRWFRRTLMEGAAGPVEVPGSWTCRPPIYENPEDVRPYAPCPGYELIQGEGRAEGVLLGGHTGLMELDGTPLAPKAEDWAGAILFLEDIPSFFSPGQLDAFLDWLGKSGALERLRGIVIGRIGEKRGFEEHAARIRRTVGEEYGRPHLPVLYGLPFGHISPQCPMPYGVQARIDCDARAFSFLEAGVL